MAVAINAVNFFLIFLSFIYMKLKFLGRAVYWMALDSPPIGNSDERSCGELFSPLPMIGIPHQNHDYYARSDMTVSNQKRLDRLNKLEKKKKCEKLLITNFRKFRKGCFIFSLPIEFESAKLAYNFTYTDKRY